MGSAEKGPRSGQAHIVGKLIEIEGDLWLIFVVGCFYDTEVGHADSFVASNQQVGRLHVPVDHAPRVGVGESFSHLDGDLQDPLPLSGSDVTGHQPLLQGAPGEKVEKE